MWWQIVYRFTGSHAILSGPAGGVVGYAMTTYTKDSSRPVIGFDMGGRCIYLTILNFDMGGRHIYLTVFNFDMGGRCIYLTVINFDMGGRCVSHCL